VQQLPNFIASTLGKICPNVKITHHIVEFGRLAGYQLDYAFCVASVYYVVSREGRLIRATERCHGTVKSFASVISVVWVSGTA